jgi:hypothetical protein
MSRASWEKARNFALFSFSGRVGGADMRDAEHWHAYCLSII